jgi:hypothetical protein
MRVPMTTPVPAVIVIRQMIEGSLLFSAITPTSAFSGQTRVFNAGRVSRCSTEKNG